MINPNLPVKRRKKHKKLKRPYSPDTYDASLLPMVKAMCRLGATDPEVAEGLGISRNTLIGWRNRHPALVHAMEVGKDEADTRVERSLFQRAIGYDYEAVKVMLLTEYEYDKEGNKIASKQVPHQEKYREHVIPDVNAQRLWLTSRRRAQWRSDVSTADQAGGATTILNVEAQLLAQISGIFNRHAGREVKLIDGVYSEAES